MIHLYVTLIFFKQNFTHTDHYKPAELYALLAEKSVHALLLTFVP